MAKVTGVNNGNGLLAIAFSDQTVQSTFQDNKFGDSSWLIIDFHFVWFTIFAINMWPQIGHSH